MLVSVPAPTEKHLEDWIVANPRQFLSSWWLNSDDTTTPFIDYVVARQVCLPYGIADLFVKCPNATAVIELKKGVIDAATIAQCLRYMECFNHIRMMAHIDLWHTDPDFTTPYYGETLGVVVGYSIADKHIPFICESLGIIPVLYDYIEDSYLFSPDHHWTLPAAVEHYRERAQGAIGDAIKHEFYETPVSRRTQSRGVR